jgi:hypothetical protein
MSRKKYSCRCDIPGCKNEVEWWATGTWPDNKFTLTLVFCKQHAEKFKEFLCAEATDSSNERLN